MIEDQQESWMSKIRNFAPIIEKAEYELFKSKADVQKINAKLKAQAIDKGFKTVSG